MPSGVYKHKSIQGFQEGNIPWNKGESSWNKGKKTPEETRKKLSEAKKGSKNPFWKGGISSINDTLRKSIEYRLWREAVYTRDNWTCQKCEIIGTELHPHHVLNFAQYIELRFAIDNGITLCTGCHRNFHKKYGNRDNTKEQLEEFLEND